MQCPKCKSEDAVKLSLVHSAGLADIRTKSRGHAIGLAGAGLLLAVDNFATTGTSQSRLSKLAAPPRKKRYRNVILAWLIGLAIGSWLILFIDAPTPSLDSRTFTQIHWFVSVFSTAMILILAVLWRFNHSILPRRRELWNRSSMCRRCGEIFHSPVIHQGP